MARRHPERQNLALAMALEKGLDQLATYHREPSESIQYLDS